MLFLLLFAGGSDISSSDESAHFSLDHFSQALEDLDRPCRDKSPSHEFQISDEGSDIEVLEGCDMSFDDSLQYLMESAMRLEADVISGGCVKVISQESCEDYVVLDGYESDVDSQCSGSEELKQSL